MSLSCEISIFVRCFTNLHDLQPNEFRGTLSLEFAIKADYKMRKKNGRKKERRKKVENE